MRQAEKRIIGNDAHRVPLSIDVRCKMQGAWSMRSERSKFRETYRDFDELVYLCHLRYPFLLGPCVIVGRAFSLWRFTRNEDNVVVDFSGMGRRILARFPTKTSLVRCCLCAAQGMG